MNYRWEKKTNEAGERVADAFVGGVSVASVYRDKENKHWIGFLHTEDAGVRGALPVIVGAPNIVRAMSAIDLVLQKAKHDTARRLTALEAKKLVGA